MATVPSNKKRAFEHVKGTDSSSHENERKKFRKPFRPHGPNPSKPDNRTDAFQTDDQDLVRRARTWLDQHVALAGQLLDDSVLAQKCSSLAGPEVIAPTLEVAKNMRTKSSILFPNVSQAGYRPSIKELNSGPKLPIISNLNIENLNMASDARSKCLPDLPPIHDGELEQAVFTHRGALSFNQKYDRARYSYERLEFLGDAYLEMVASRYLYHTLPASTAPNKLSSLRENLVKNETLAYFAQGYRFDERTQVPPEYTTKAPRSKDEKKKWTKLLGDVFEAYIGAVVESNPTGGYETVERWLSTLWKHHLPEAAQDHEEPHDPDAKAKLASKVISSRISLDYVETNPPDMKKPGYTVYTMGVYITGWGYTKQLLGTGEGISKQVAGCRAATKALVNPVVSSIHASKREYDARVREERNRAGGPRQDYLTGLDLQFQVIMAPWAPKQKSTTKKSRSDKNLSEKSDDTQSRQR